MKKRERRVVPIGGEMDGTGEQQAQRVSVTSSPKKDTWRAGDGEGCA